MGNLDDVRAFVAMLQGTMNAVQQALQKGVSHGEMQRQSILAPWRQFAAGFIKEDGHIETP
jgi:hypothetical protein